MSGYLHFIPEFVLCTNSSLFWFRIANELSEFRNYLNDKIICQSMVDGVVRNPAFTALSDEPQFQRIVERLKTKLPGGAV